MSSISTSNTNNYTSIVYIENILAYSSLYKIIICKDCKFTIKNKDRVLIHVAKYHRDKLEDISLDRINIAIKDLDIIAIDNLELPISYTTLFKDLPLIDGFLCLVIGCNYLTKNNKSIRKHLNEKHSINLSNKDSSFKNKYFRALTIQPLVSNPKAIYFIPKQDNIIRVNKETIETIDNIEDTRDSIINSYNILEENLDLEDYIAKDNKDINELDSFLSYTYFKEYIDGFKVKELVKLVYPIEKSKDDINFTYLKLAKDITLDLFYSKEKLVSNINNFYLNLLNTEIPNKEKPNLRPFKLLDTKQAKSRYYNSIGNFIVYLLRVYYNSNNLDLISSKGPIIDNKLLDILNTYLTRIINEKDTIKKASIKEKAFISIINILISLVEGNISQKSFSNRGLLENPLITYLIVDSIDPNLETFRRPIDIENRCSFYIYNLRLVLIIYLNYIEKDTLKKSKDFNFSTTFNTFYYKYYTNSNPSPFTEITRIRALTRRIDINTIKPARIVEVDSNNIVIDTSNINIPNLKRFIIDIYTRLEDILYKNLLFIERKELDIFLDTTLFKDDPFNNSNNFYFTKFINREQDLSKYNNYLLERVLDPTNTLYSLFINSIIDKKDISFNKVNIEKYLKSKDNFIELLSLAIYLTSSSPLRGSELVIIKYKSTKEYGVRNLTLDRTSSLIRLETSYTKSRSITRLDSSTIRFLSPLLSRIIKLYLLLVVPFYRFIRVKYYKTTILGPYLLEINNKNITSDRLSTLLNIEASKYLNTELNINKYRQIIQFINKIYIDPKYSLVNSDSEDENNNSIIDILANRSSRIGNTTYGRTTSLFSNRTIDIEAKSREFNLKFFKYFNIDIDTNITSILKPSSSSFNSKKHARNKSSITRELSLSPKKSKVVESNIEEDIDLDLDTIDFSNISTTSNTPRVTTKDKGKEKAIDSSSINSSISIDKGYSSISLDNIPSLENTITLTPNIFNTLNKDLEPYKATRTLEDINTLFKNTRDELSSSSSSSSSIKSIDLEIEATSSKTNRNIFTKLNKNTKRSKEPLEYLKELFKDSTSTFNSKEQALAIDNILSLEPYITYIGGTNSGKSLLFFLPSYINKDRVYIVVVPRVSLKLDLVRRGIKFGLNSRVYSPNTLNTSSNLVFIGIEEFTSSLFKVDLYNLKRNNKEITIVIDEAHLIITEELFRNKLNNIGTIVKDITQLILLSATLPDPILELLELEFSIKLTNKVIRTSTTRTNIKYIKLEINSLKEAIELTKATINNYILPNLEEKEKYIIFNNNKAELLEIADYLNIPTFFSSNIKEIKDKKLELLEEFLTSTSIKGIASTIAAGLGLDYSYIRYSIHLGSLYNIINIEQEIGRIGRDNSLAIAIILYNPKSIAKLQPPKADKIYLSYIDFKYTNNYYLSRLLLEDTCIRRPLEELFNNNPNFIDYITSNIVLCSLCEKRAKKLTITKEVATIKETTRLNTRNSITNILDLLLTTCFYCLLNKNIDYNKHTTFRCYKKDSITIDFIKEGWKIEKSIKKNRSFPNGTCFQCFLPNNICFNRDIKVTRCKYQDLVLPTIKFLIILENTNTYNFYIEDFISSSKDLDSLALFLSKTTKVNNINCIKAIDIINNLSLENIVYYLTSTLYKKPSSNDITTINTSNNSNINSSIDNNTSSTRISNINSSSSNILDLLKDSRLN